MTRNEFGELLDKKLAGVATKKDLKTFITKKDAKNFATKDDLKPFATKGDLKDIEVRFGFKLVQIEDRFDKKLEAKFSKYTNMVLDKVDQVLGQIQTLREEGVFQQAQIERVKQHIGLEV